MAFWSQEIDTIQGNVQKFFVQRTYRRPSLDMWLEVCKYVLSKRWRHSASTYDRRWRESILCATHIPPAFLWPLAWSLYFSSHGVTQEVHLYFLSDAHTWSVCFVYCIYYMYCVFCICYIYCIYIACTAYTAYATYTAHIAYTACIEYTAYTVYMQYVYNWSKNPNDIRCMLPMDGAISEQRPSLRKYICTFWVTAYTAYIAYIAYTT